MSPESQFIQCCTRATRVLVENTNPGAHQGLQNRVSRDEAWDADLYHLLSGILPCSCWWMDTAFGHPSQKVVIQAACAEQQEAPSTSSKPAVVSHCPGRKSFPRSHACPPLTATNQVSLPSGKAKLCVFVNMTAFQAFSVKQGVLGYWGLLCLPATPTVVPSEASSHIPLLFSVRALASISEPTKGSGALKSMGRLVCVPR